MKIKVDYEECSICEEAADCENLKEMQVLVDATIEALRKMTGNTLPQHEVHT